VAGADGMNQAQLAFVERVGLFFESNGIPRMAGRMIGALLLAPDGHRSMVELCGDLDASMGSMSTMARLLEQSRFVQRAVVPGDRRVQLRIDGEAWGNHMMRETEKCTALRELAERALAFEQQSDRVRGRLTALRDTAAFWEAHLPEALDRWRDIQGLPPVAPSATERLRFPVTFDDPGDAEDAFIEDLALLMEDSGLPRMAGRIFGRLLVAEPAEQSMAELESRLRASKGSISTMTRLLLSGGVIERAAVPGERRVYVRLREDFWDSFGERVRARAEAMRSLGEEGLEVLGKRASRRSLEILRDSGAFWLAILPELEAKAAAA